ncbi:MAG: RNA polymerase sigma factor [Oscillospiraceae bacterium]|nr:RNA polymerase sigma factor [Oscillospiraceae bacterium]
MDSNIPETLTNSPRDINDYFNAVYADTFQAVSRYVVSKCGNILDSEDILQNIYTRFFSRINKKGYSDIESSEAFLINIAKFECKNYFGALKRRSKTSSFSDYSEEQMVEIEAEMSRHEKKLEDVLCNELLARQIFDDITNDDPVTGKIFYMHFVLDMKLDEIANELELNLSSVKNKLYRTIERQKKKFNI